MLHIYEKQVPHDDRPRRAIEAAKEYIKTGDGPSAAAASAADAAAASAADADADAARAAAYAADDAAAAHAEIQDQCISRAFEILGIKKVG